MKRKLRKYLFKGRPVMALSKDEVLRLFKLSDNPKNRAMVCSVKKGG